MGQLTARPARVFAPVGAVVAPSPPMDERPIGVFDSGLGGLTIVRALIDLLPDEHLVYFGDTARFPYGERTPAELRRFSAEVAGVLSQHDVKMLVVACNSASSVALEHLRSRHQVPVVGVIEPGVRAALEVTRGRLGVIGTEATVASGAYETAVRRLRGGVALASVACPGFVDLVERAMVDTTEAYGLVAMTLAPLRVEGVDTLILGCTHYPHLARTISDVMGREVVLVSSAEETAFEVRDILERTGLARRPDGGQARRTFLTSGDPEVFTSLGERFLGPEVDGVRAWRWPEPAASEAS
jgi:glutamate racemase